MKGFRCFLVSLLALTCCTVILVTPTVNAATKVTLSAATTTAGYTRTWYPANDHDGYVLTSGGTQVLQFYLSESGNKIDVGFKRNATGYNYSVYSGTLSGKSIYSSQVLSGPSGYYKPYLKNKNATVSITSTTSSYINYK